jgi:hypothetical protein
MLAGAAKDDAVKYEVSRKVNKVIHDHFNKVGELKVKDKNVEEAHMFNELLQERM